MFFILFLLIILCELTQGVRLLVCFIVAQSPSCVSSEGCASHIIRNVL